MTTEKINKSKTLTFRMTVSDYLNLKKIAKSKQGTVTDFVHEQIIDSLPKKYICCRKCKRPLIERKYLLGECAVKCRCGGWGESVLGTVPAMHAENDDSGGDKE